MKNPNISVIILGLLLGVSINLLLQKGCGSSDGETIEVVIPEKSGSFESQEANYSETDTVYLTEYLVKDSAIEVATENPVNASLVEAYESISDSLERFKLYLAAIQIREFENSFSDSLIDITVCGEVQGQLNYLSADYIIKAQKYKTKIPKPLEKNVEFFLGSQILVGPSVISTGISLGLRKKEGPIYKLGVAGVDGVTHYLVQVDVPIFKFRVNNRKQKINKYRLLLNAADAGR